MKQRPSILICGTGATWIGAQVYYQSFAALHGAVILPLKAAGLANSRDSAESIHAYVVREIREPVDIAMAHSQGAPVGLYLKLKYPQWYGAVVLVAGPVNGMPLCVTWSPVVACIRALSPASRFVADIQSELQSAPEGVLDQVTSISSSGDGLVHPHRTYVHRARNYCLAPRHLHLGLGVNMPGTEMIPGSVGHIRFPAHSEVRRLSLLARGLATAQAA